MLKNTFHEVIFIMTAVSAQLLMPFNFAATILPIGEILAGIDGSYAQAAWLPSAFCMGNGSFLLISGQLGDILGRKKIYITALFLHSLANLGIGFTTSVYQFSTLAGLSGMFLALAQPSGLALLTETFPPGMKRNMALSAYAVSFMGGWVLGCYNAAIWAQFFVWRLIFWSIAGIAFLMACSAVFVIPAGLHASNGSYKDLDYLGMIVGLSAMLLITFAITQGAVVGWSHTYIYTTCTVGVLLVVLFLLIEYKVEKPVMPLCIWRNPLVAVSVGCLCLIFIGFGILFSYITSLLQLRGDNMIMIATLWIPGGLSAVVVTGTIPLILHTGFQVIFPICAVTIGISHLLVALSPLHQTYWDEVFVAIVFGMPACIWMPMGAATVVLASVRPAEQGIAAGLIAFIASLPVAWGLSFASILQQKEEGNSPLTGIHAASWLGFSLSGAALLVSLIAHKTLVIANEKFNPHLQKVESEPLLNGVN